MKIYFIILLSGFASLPGALASGYSTGFGIEYDHGMEVAGQDGWSIDDPISNLSFFVDLNRSMAAALGGYYDVPSGTRVKLSHPVGIPLAGASFSVNIAIVGSTEDFPGRDRMAWCLVNPAGEKLFSIGFEPAATNPGLLHITWSTGNDIPVLTGWAVFYNAPYHIDVTFAGGGVSDLPFVARITGSGSSSFSGSLSGMAGESWAAVEAHFIVNGAAAGDNFLAFDNISALAPPAVDADGDGYSAEMEAWFGTSDASLDSTPGPVISRSTGTASIAFPSIPGNTYHIDSSGDLQMWATATVTATTATTLWLDPAGSAARHRYFRIRKP